MAVKRKFSGKSKAAKAKRTKATRYVRKKKTVAWKNMTILGRGFPKKLTCTHRYVENITVNTATGPGSQNSYLFKCNGMYDPNDTGGGHQPIYFDQCSALYDHYCVIGSKITVRFTADGLSNPATHVMLRVDDDTNVPTNTQETMEQNGAKFRVLPGGSPFVVTLKNKWSAKKYFGGAVLANNELQGSATADPTEKSYYQIAIRPMDGVSNVSVFMQVTIDYIAVWKELKNISGS